MPAFELSACFPQSISTTTVGGLEVPTLSAGLKGVRLRRPGANPLVHGRESALIASGVVTLEPVPMSGLVELFGVDLSVTWDRTEDPGDYCGLQVSVDGGATFLAWAGAAWVAQAIDGTFSTLEDVNDHCAALTLANPRSLSFRVRLAAYRDSTPAVTAVVAYAEWRYEPLLDFYQILSERMAAARFPHSVRRRLAAASSVVPLQDQVAVDVTRPIRVFNVTADPLMNEDLFASVDGLTIVMTAEQPAGSEILVEACGSMPVVLVRQDELLRKTQVPSLEVHVGRVQAAKSDVGRQYDFKRGDVSRRVRVRQAPSTRVLPVEVKVVTAEPRTALAAPDAVRAALSDTILRSPASGQVLTVVETTPSDESTNLVEGVEIARWSGRFFLQFPSFAYEELEATREIRMTTGSRKRSWETREIQ